MGRQFRGTERADKIVKARLTTSELRAVSALAYREGLTIADLIRWSLHDYAVRRSTPKNWRARK